MVEVQSLNVYFSGDRDVLKLKFISTFLPLPPLYPSAQLIFEAEMISKDTGKEMIRVKT